MLQITAGALRLLDRCLARSRAPGDVVSWSTYPRFTAARFTMSGSPRRSRSPGRRSGSPSDSSVRPRFESATARVMSRSRISALLRLRARHGSARISELDGARVVQGGRISALARIGGDLEVARCVRRRPARDRGHGQELESLAAGGPRCRISPGGAAAMRRRSVSRPSMLASAIARRRGRSPGRSAPRSRRASSSVRSWSSSAGSVTTREGALKIAGPRRNEPRSVARCAAARRATRAWAATAAPSWPVGVRLVARRRSAAPARRTARRRRAPRSGARRRGARAPVVARKRAVGDLAQQALHEPIVATLRRARIVVDRCSSSRARGAQSIGPMSSGRRARTRPPASARRRRARGPMRPAQASARRAAARRSARR